MTTAATTKQETRPQFDGYFRRLGEEYLLTNEAGNYHFADSATLQALVEGSPVAPELEAVLRQKLFLLGPAEQKRAVRRYQERHSFLRYGPNLHILVVSKRCNTTCTYCHASRAPESASGFDMSLETARAAVDMALSSTSPSITIEFQGGEPLLNWEVCRFVIEYARERNKSLRKHLGFSMVTNLAAMDEEKAAFLIAPDIHLCTSLDGTEALHNKHRRHRTGAHQKAVQWIHQLNQRYLDLGFDPRFYRVQALLTTTRATLAAGREVVDFYVELGQPVIHLRPLDPFGFAQHTQQAIGYSPQEFLDFYAATMDYIIELNRQGVDLLEKTANILLTKILAGVEPNFLDLRSPCGAGIGQVTYHYDGKVFTCDEGRMVSDMGDDAFVIGAIGTSSLESCLGHEVVKTLAIASTLDTQPECSSCAFKPYCGICPVYNYQTQRSLVGQMATNERCQILKGTFDYLFEKLRSGDEHTVKTFQRWASIIPPSECKAVM